MADRKANKHSMKVFPPIVLTLALVVVAAGWFPTSSLAADIEYVRSEIPKVEIPPYTGERYTELVPDTLDLSEMARLAINGLTGPTNPEYDYELYWRAHFFRNPAVVYHDFNDWCQLKFMEALPLMRVITGSAAEDQVDRVWTDVVLKSIGPDGLYYIPMNGRPWAKLGIFDNHDMMTRVWKTDGSRVPISSSEFSQISNYYVCGRGMNILMVYYLRDQNPIWLEIMKKMVDRMSEIVVDKGDYAYFPSGLYEPNAQVSKEGPMPSDMNETGGRFLLPLAQLYRVTGYEPAGRLAKKLTNYLVHHTGYFDEQGRFSLDSHLKERLKDKSQTLGGHFHNHAYSLHAILEYAIAADDRELIKSFVIPGYEWAKTQGSDLVGFFPEFILPDYPTNEICEVADMLAIAAKLSAAGEGDYYSDIERWTRNQFVANQLERCDWVYRAGARSETKTVAYNEVAERVGERSIGAFAGWSTGNEWAIDVGIMHCCTGNAARSIYYVWECAVDFEDDELKVNLLMNRASPWVDVNSHIPYKGQVDLSIKKTCKSVLVHKPEWIAVGSSEMTCEVNGEKRSYQWKNSYIDIGSAQAGDKVVVSFPITEREVTEKLGAREYALVLKGNTVVHIDPPGRNGPLYLRDHYRENETRWVNRERFVSETILDY